jgi:hypothetical protein
MIQHHNYSVLTGEERYWLALGRLIERFASVEVSIQLVLWTLSEVRANVATAIFSGTRTEQASSFIRRIFESRGEPTPELLARAFDRLTIVNTIRNDIVHYGIQIDEVDGMHASNAVVALPGKERRTKMSVEVLEELWSDLGIILHCLNAFVLPLWPDSPPEVVADHLKGAQLPWRYTPPPQSQASKTKQTSKVDKRTLARDNQPKSSQERFWFCRSTPNGQSWSCLISEKV